MDDSSGGQSWAQALLTGLSATVDSQLANQYGVNTPYPNSQYGTAGQAQTSGVPVAGTSPIIWVAVAAAAALLLFMVARK
jgi:hypothetical protein